MKQSPYLLAGACIASVAIGYALGGMKGGSPAGKDSTDAPQNTRAETRTGSRDRGHAPRGGPDNGASEELLSSLLSGRSPKELSGDEISGLVISLSRNSQNMDALTRTRQNYQLQLLLSRLSSDQLEAAAPAIAEDPEARSWGGISSVVGAMVARNSSRALEWAKGQKNAPAMTALIISGLSRDQPDVAVDLYRGGLMDGSLAQSLHWETGYNISLSMARQGKEHFLEFLDSLPQQQQGTMLMNALRELPVEDRTGLLDEVYQRSKNGIVESWAMKNTLSNLAVTDPATAHAWIAKLPAGEERASLNMALVSHLGRYGDPEASEAAVKRAIADSPGTEKQLLNHLMESGWGGTEQLAILARNLPPGVEFHAEDLKEHVESSNLLYRGLGGMADLAAVLKSPDEQATLLEGALNGLADRYKQSSGGRVNENDFLILQHRLNRLNLTGDNAARVNAAFEAARAAGVKPTAGR